MLEGPSTTSTLLSVVILNWNCGNEILNCIDSVLQHAGSLNPEIWVVDNGSTNRSLEAIRQRFPTASLICSPANVGIARGRNLGLERIATRYVLCLDADTLVLPRALEQMVGFLEKHPSVGVVGCRLLDGNGVTEPYLAPFPSVASHVMHWTGINALFPRVRWIPSHHASSTEPLEPQPVAWVCGACNMTRTAILRQTGLRNPGLFYADDMEWCYRVWKSGWSIYYLPNVPIIHLGGLSGVLWSQHVVPALEDTFLFIEERYGRGFRSLVKALAVFGLAERVAIFGLMSSLIPRTRLREQAVWFQRLLLACFGQVSSLRPCLASEKFTQGNLTRE